MARIFISYAKEDRSRIEPLVDTLGRHGHRAWWDRLIEGGDEWAERIDTELARCQVVAVFLSRASVDSVWVRMEAQKAKRRRTLLPFLLEPVVVPAEFGDVQAVPLYERTEPATQVLEAVEAFLQGRRRRRRLPAAALVLLALAAVLAGSCWLSGVCTLPGAASPERAASPPSTPAAALRVAVLPLEFSGDPTLSPIAKGLAYVMSQQLARIGGFSMAADYAVNALPSDQDWRRSATRLRVDQVVSGRISVVDGEARLTLSTRDTRSGVQRSLPEFQGSLEQLQRLEQQAVTALIDVLGGRSAAIRDGGGSPAYTDYLLGTARLARAVTVPDLRAAEAVFLDVIDRDGAFAPAYAGLCEALMRKFELSRDRAAYEEGSGWCQQAALLDPDDTRVVVAQGWLALQSGDSGAAARFFEQAIAAGDGGTSARLGLAQLHAEAGDEATAGALLRQATLAEPGDWRTHSGLAQHFSRSGDREAAIARYRMALKLDPGNPSLLNNLGVELLMANRLRAAAETWEEALARLEGEDRVLTLTNVGGIRYLLRDYEAAQAALLEATRRSAQDFRAWANLGDTQRMLGAAGWRRSYERAIELIRGEIAVAGASTLLDANLLSNEAALGKPPDPARLEALHDAASGDPETLRLLALAYLRAERHVRARALLQEAIDAGYPEPLIAADPEFAAVGADSTDS
jgi:Flp pilus assembly protein TadD/TolB-like protein